MKIKLWASLTEAWSPGVILSFLSPTPSILRASLDSAEAGPRHSIVYTPHLFIHLSIDEHLGCFHTLAIGNNVTISMKEHVSVQNTVHIPVISFQDIYIKEM